MTQPKQSSNDSEIVVPTISGEKTKAKIQCNSYSVLCKDENSSEEYSLRDLSVLLIQAADLLLMRTEHSLTESQVPRQIRVRTLLRATPL